MTDRKRELIFFVGALLLLTLFFAIRIGGSEFFARDAKVYLTLIATWASDGADAAYAQMNVLLGRANIPPLFIAGPAGLVRLLGLSPTAAALTWNYLAGIFFLIGLWLIGLALFSNSRETGFLMLAGAIYPSFIRIFAEILRDGSYIGWLTLAVGLTLLAIKRNRWYLGVAAGIAVALATLTRQEGWEFLLCLFVWLAWEWLIAVRQGNRNKLQLLRFPTVLLAVFLVCLAVPTLWISAAVPRCEWTPWMALSKIVYMLRTWIK